MGHKQGAEYPPVGSGGLARLLPYQDRLPCELPRLPEERKKDTDADKFQLARPFPIGGAQKKRCFGMSNQSVSMRTGRRMAAMAMVAAASLGLAACGGKERPRADLAASQITTIGVNSYLWRATLDALSFMPLLQADSAGGVIVTDWYANPANPGERSKVTVSILDQDLRADALRVTASRQVSQGGAWVDAPVQAATVQKLEEVILTRARDLRRSAIRG